MAAETDDENNEQERSDRVLNSFGPKNTRAGPGSSRRFGDHKGPSNRKRQRPHSLVGIASLEIPPEQQRGNNIPASTRGEFMNNEIRLWFDLKRETVSVQFFFFLISNLKIATPKTISKDRCCSFFYLGFSRLSVMSWALAFQMSLAMFIISVLVWVGDFLKLPVGDPLKWSTLSWPALYGPPTLCVCVYVCVDWWVRRSQNEVVPLFHMDIHDQKPPVVKLK